MEGQVYLCSWKKDKGEYFIWLKTRPDIIISASTFGEAQVQMREKLLWEYNDGEAQLNFDKPLPKGIFPIEYSSPEIYMVAGNEGMDCEPFQPGIYTKGYCIRCKRGLGKRTKQPLFLSDLPTKANGAVQNGYNDIFSEDFLNLFTLSELKNLNFLQVKSITKSKKNFFELVGLSLTDCVGVKDFLGKYCELCSTCGRIGFYYFYENTLFEFIDRSSLPDKIPNAFVLGNYSYSLCVTGKKWREIQDKEGAKGIVAIQIGVVNNINNIILPEDLLENKPKNLYAYQTKLEEKAIKKWNKYLLGKHGHPLKE